MGELATASRRFRLLCHIPSLNCNTEMLQPEPFSESRLLFCANSFTSANPRRSKHPRWSTRSPAGPTRKPLIGIADCLAAALLGTLYNTSLMQRLLLVLM